MAALTLVVPLLFLALVQLLIFAMPTASPPSERAWVDNNNNNDNNNNKKNNYNNNDTNKNDNHNNYNNDNNNKNNNKKNDNNKNKKNNHKPLPQRAWLGPACKPSSLGAFVGQLPKLRRLRQGSLQAPSESASVVLRVDELGCKVPGSTSVFNAALCLTKNLLGSSMFCLPLALQQGSVLPGLAAMLAVCLASGSSFMLLAYLCEKLYGQSYRDIWAASLGPKTSVIVDFSIVVNGLAVCMLYQVLVADLVQQAAAALFGVADLSRSLIVWVNALLIIAPLCHLRNLSALRYTSITGLCLVLGVFAYVVSDFFGHWQVATSNLVAGAFHLDRGIFSMVAISVGAFQAHYNSPRFFKELGCNLQQHSRMTIIAYTLTFAIYSIFAVAGMGLFGSSTTGNVLKNYAAAGSSVVVAGWVGTIFNMNFTYPLVFVSARNSLISMVPALEKANEKRPRAAHVAITCSMLVVTSCAACLTDDISFVTGMLGATLGSCISWIFPAVIYLTATRRKRQASGFKDSTMNALALQEPPLAPKKRLQLLSALLILFGSLSMAVGVLLTVGAL